MMLATAAAVFSALLLITGATKLRHPKETARALGELGFPLGLPLTYLLAASEVVVGSWALIRRTGPSLAAQGTLYVAFLFWIGMALRSGVPIRSCGCLGKDDTPPYWGHTLLNATASAVSIGAALTWVGQLTTTWSIADGVLVVVGAWLAWMVIDQGARTAGLAST